MDAMLEKKLDTPFFAGNSGNRAQEASNYKGFEGGYSVPTDENCSGNSTEKTAEIPPETLVSPIPDDAPLPPKRFNTIMVDGKTVEVSATWSYRNAQNKVLCYILRFDVGNGKKRIQAANSLEY